MECEFCKKLLSSLKSLKSHQQKTKYCLDIQGKSIQDGYTCNFCTKKFFNTDSIKRHEKVCKKEKIEYKIKIEKQLLEQLEQIEQMEKEKLEQLEQMEKEKIEYKIDIEQMKKEKIDIEKQLLEKLEQMKKEKIDYKINIEKQLLEYKIQVEKLQGIIENIAIKAVSKPNITNNNNIENLIFLDFKETNIQDKVDNFFTIDHLKNGIKGVARFTKDFIINTDDDKLKYICTDVSRGFFKYMDENGVVQKDVKATKLKNSIKEPIINKSKDIFMNENTRIFDEINNTMDCLQLDRLNNKMNVLTEGFIQVKNIDDNINEYSKELVMVL